MFGQGLRLKSKLYQQETPVPTEPKLNSRGWPVEHITTDTQPPSRPEIKTVTGYMYNGEYYATEAQAQQARLVSKVHELFSTPDVTYPYPGSYRYLDGWNDCVKLVALKLPELNRIINS